MALFARREDEDWQVSKSCIQERFKQLLRLSRWTDCSFKVGTQNVEVIHGHKLVLAVSSPVFEALFFGPLAGSGDTIIPVPDIEPHTFKKLLQYIYSDEAELNGIEEVGDLLYAAKKYLVEPLSKLCLDYLVEHTWIRTLWQVLEVAEALDEERLTTACLKVMSRYHYKIWGGEGEQLSAEMVRRLLEQTEMNMSELELWEMLEDWAGREVGLRGLPDCPDSRRQVMLEADLLSRIRLLSIPHDQLHRLQPILTKEEVEALKEGRELLVALSKEKSARRCALPAVWRSAREIINRKSNLWVTRAEVVCNISSSARVLVIGFEVLTRTAASLYELGKNPTSSSSSYRERLAVSVKDSEGNLLQTTNYDTYAYFNTSQKIQLDRPLWFEENTVYTVSIGYIYGQYPYCSVAEDCSSWSGAKFFFDEMFIVEGIPSKIVSSYVVSVLYAV